MRWFKRIELLPALLGITVLVCSGCLGDAAEFDAAEISDEAWPGPTWQKIDRPERLGWSSEKLAEASGNTGVLDYMPDVGSAPGSTAPASPVRSTSAVRTGGRSFFRNAYSPLPAFPTAPPSACAINW